MQPHKIEEEPKYWKKGISCVKHCGNVLCHTKIHNLFLNKNVYFM